MYKWYLIYSYHDLFMAEFYSDSECLEYLEQRCEELENRIRKMEIENNLMRELLSRPVTYTYGIR